MAGGRGRQEPPTAAPRALPAARTASARTAAHVPAHVPGQAGAPLDWPRTLAARGAQSLRREHLRQRPQRPHAAALHCFVLDCSSSMLVHGRLALAKGVLAELMAMAYRWRDRAALIRLGGDGAAVLMRPARAPSLPALALAPIGGGGGTPLAAALQLADGLLARHSGGVRWLWLLTDGHTRETPPRPAHAQRLCVLDFDGAAAHRPALGRAAALAAHWQAQHWHAHELWRAQPQKTGSEAG